jgi:hypothetical protein
MRHDTHLKRWTRRDAGPRRAGSAAGSARSYLARRPADCPLPSHINGRNRIQHLKCVPTRRFRPVTRGGDIVPTLYASDLPQGALSETVFHDVPVRGKGRRILRKALVPMVRSTIIPLRPLQLVEMHGAGLRRLQASHGELIESSSRQYPRTAVWGQALHDFADHDGFRIASGFVGPWWMGGGCRTCLGVSGCDESSVAWGEAGGRSYRGGDQHPAGDHCR